MLQRDLHYDVYSDQFSFPTAPAFQLGCLGDSGFAIQHILRAAETGLGVSTWPNLVQEG